MTKRDSEINGIITDQKTKIEQLATNQSLQEQQLELEYLKEQLRQERTAKSNYVCETEWLSELKTYRSIQV